jgi:hypothetical protein
MAKNLPRVLRRPVFPGLKRYAALAHEHGRMFWVHTDGNHYVTGTIEDLISLDAVHLNHRLAHDHCSHVR